MRIKFVITLFIVVSLVNANAQTNTDSIFRHDQKVLSSLAKRVLSVRFNDSLAIRLNNELQEYFEIVLNKEKVFDFRFDSIAPIAHIVSEDELVKLFTWNIKTAKGTYKQYGFVQYYVKSKDKVLTYRLIDNSEEQENPHNLTLSADNWYGAVYYDMVETKYQDDKLYTLIGWDGNNLFSTKKVIESLVFSSSGKPKFGKSVFKFGREKVKRVIYEYSQMANMMIRYDEDLKMIVMDHLSPGKEIHYGNYKMYGPDLSYDALKFDKEYWIYYSDIDYKKEQEKQGFFEKLKTRRAN